MIDILIPTIGRAHRIGRIAANITDATTEPNVVFITETHDTATIGAIETAGYIPIINTHTPNYAGAIQTGYEHTSNRYVFLGADDLYFHQGWDVEAIGRMDGWVTIVGTNDLLNPYVTQGTHSTHSLIDRDYIDTIGGVIDQPPGTVLNTIYSHQYTDTEFIGTAKARARFRPCLESVVEHLHAYSGKGEKPDATTAKAFVHADEDSAIYDSRQHLWWEISR